MSVMDFQLFRIKHLAWKTRLRSFIDGRGGLTPEQAVSHKDCSLGKWLYSGGLKQYSNLPEIHDLEKVHVELHDIVKRTVALKGSGKDAEAELEYKKISPVSDDIIRLLTQIEAKVKSAA